MAPIVTIDPDTRDVEQQITRIYTWGGSDVLRRVFNNVGRSIQSRILLCFRMQTSPYGDKWAPLKYRTGQALQKSGRLFASIVVNATDQDVTVGTNLTNAGVSYPAVQQFGAIIKPKNGRYLVFQIGTRTIFAKKVVIPARAFFPVRPNGETELPQSWAIAALNEFRKGLDL